MFKQILSIVVLSCVVLSSVTMGQSIKAYQDFDIRNTSGQILDVIHGEYSATSPGEFSALIETKSNGLLSTEQSSENFSKEFSSLLEATARTQQSREFLRKSSAELIKYNVDVVTNFADVLPSKYVTKFLAPAVQRTVELKTNKWVADLIQENREARDKIIVSRLNLLFTKGIDVSAVSDQVAFENAFATSQADIPALNRDDLPVFNHEMLKQAYSYIKANRGQLEQLKRRLDEKTPEQKEFDFSKIRAEYTLEIAGMQKRVMDEVKQDFANAGKILARLAENQTEILSTINDLKTSVSNNEKDIAGLEKDIVAVKNEITGLRRDVTSLQGDVVNLKTLQNKHSKLLAQNSLKLNVISKYTFQGLSPKQQLQGLKDGDFDDVFQNDVKKIYKEQLERIVKAETIVSYSQNISEGAKVSIDALVTSGVLDGKDAQRANKLLGQLVSATQIASGAGRMYAGDMTGAFSVIQGLGGLSGRTKKPQPSPELKLLREMFDAMNIGFKDINKRLDGITQDIVNFRNDVFEMYKSLSTSLQVITVELEKINWKLDNLKLMVYALLFNNYRSCEGLSKTVEFKKYSDFERFRERNTIECLKALDDFTKASDDSYFYMKLTADERSEEIIRRVYEPVKNLFKQIYGNDNEAKAALIYPVQRASDTTAPLLAIHALLNTNTVTNEDGNSHFAPNSQLRITSVSEYQNSLNEYINYEMLSEFSEMFVLYSPYFEISKSADFLPDELEDYLKRPQDVKEKNLQRMNRRVDKLIRLTEVALAQQSLMAGNTLIEAAYTILFTANQKDQDIKLVNKALMNNRLFAHNFAANLLHKSLRISENPSRFEIFKRILEEVNSKGVVSPDQIKELNGLVYLPIVFKFKEPNIHDHNVLYISLNRAGETLDLAIPSANTILENRMINSDAIPVLLKTREALLEKHLDQNFTAKIAHADKEFTRDHFKYLYANAYVSTPQKASINK